MPAIRAVIFDMDGILIDTEPVWRRVEIETFGSLGLHLTEEQCMETMGVRVDEVVRIWHDRHPWEAPSCSVVTRQIVQGVIEHVRAHGEPKAGAARAMALARHAGLRVAVASSSDQALIAAVLERLDLERYVDVTWSAEYELEGKPHPAVYLTAAKLLGVPPGECVAVEDSPNGVLSAKRAGMYCIAVPDPALADDPRFKEADLRLGSLDQFSLDMLPGCSAPVQ